jgi:hypothetical protein
MPIYSDPQHCYLLRNASTVLHLFLLCGGGEGGCLSNNSLSLYHPLISCPSDVFLRFRGFHSDLSPPPVKLLPADCEHSIGDLCVYICFFGGGGGAEYCVIASQRVCFKFSLRVISNMRLRRNFVLFADKQWTCGSFLISL